MPSGCRKRCIPIRIVQKRRKERVSSRDRGGADVWRESSNRAEMAVISSTA